MAELTEIKSNYSLSEYLILKIEETKKICKEKLTNGVDPTGDISLISSMSDVQSLLSGDIDLSDNWTGEMMPIEWSSIRAVLIENINRILVKAKEAVDKIINDVPNLVIEKLLDTLFSTIEEFVKTVIQPIDPIIKEVIYKYNYIIKQWREFKKIYKDYKAGLIDESVKKEAQNKLINELKKLDESVATVISIIFFSSTISDMLDAMKNLKSTTKGAWTRVIDELKNEFSIITELSNGFKKSNILKNLATILGVLLPLLAALAAALLCSNQTDAKIRQTAGQVRDEELEANGIDPDDISGEKEQEQLEKLYSDLSEILEYGLKNIYGYSMKYDSSGNLINEDTSTGREIIESEDTISMCQISDLSDSLEKEFNEAEQPKRYVIELGKDLIGAFFNVEVGNNISNDQIIGYYQNIPIKSKISGTIIDKKSKHIIVESNTTIENVENECQEIADNLDFTDRYTPIINKFKKISYVETYLNDFALPCRLPNLMLHSTSESFLIKLLIGSLKTKAINDSKYKLIDQYTEQSNNVVNNFKYEIKDICSPENIETSCENGNNNELKDKIFNAKKKGIQDIIRYFNNGIQQLSKTSVDENTTYMLVTDYINYLSSTEFNYDDENPYVIELFNTIRNFIKDRLKLESIDKQNLINEFNSRCIELLSSKLKVSNYYNHFSKLFKNDWYIQDEDNIIGISENLMKADETYDSVYKKMYNYIINLLDAKTLSRDNPTIDTNKITDINSFIQNNAGSSTFSDDDIKVIEKQNKAKSITKYFMILKNLSNSYNVSNSVNLKSKTQYEALILDNLTKRVIEEYNKPDCLNFYNNIDSIYDEFKTVNCPYNGTIYINNIVHEHYVYSCITDTVMNPYNMNATDDELLDMSSPKTAFTPFQLPYWLIYCAQATLVNVLVPLYWSTGLIIMGAPLLLPIIYVPIYFLSGSVSVLFGLGICGIAIWPMILNINNTAFNSTTLIPITLAIDFIKKKLNDMKGMGVKSLTVSAKPLIKLCDSEIYEIENQLDTVGLQIGLIKNGIAGVNPGKVQNIEIPLDTPDIKIENNLSNKIKDIFANVNLGEEKEEMSKDGLYHNVVVCLDPAGGKSESENKSPFTANGTHPSNWEKTKSPDEELMKFNEYKWSLEICNKIKPLLESKGINVFITNAGTAQPKARCLKAYNHKLMSNKHHIMISIGVNSIDPGDNTWKSGTNGWSIYTAKKNDNIIYYNDSVTLAESIYDNAVDKFLSNNMNVNTNLGEHLISDKNDYYKKYKIRHAEENYTVTVNAPDQNGNNQSMPTILSKNFYCDNIDDLKYLNSESGKTDIASVHVNGILNFIDKKGWS